MKTFKLSIIFFLIAAFSFSLAFANSFEDNTEGFWSARIKDDLMYCDAYCIDFFTNDNIVTGIELQYIDNSDRRDE